MPLNSLRDELLNWRRSAKREYDRQVNRDLSRQNSSGLLRRNLLELLQRAYKNALDRLSQLEAEQGSLDASSRERVLIEPLAGLGDELIEYALQKHRTSCALSNFPDEHRPSSAYIGEVLQAMSLEWEQFKKQVLDRSYQTSAAGEL